MDKLYNVEQLRKIIAEALQEQAGEFTPVIGKDVEKDNKKNNAESYKEAQKRAKDFDGGLTEETNTSDTVSAHQQAANVQSKGMERLKYDQINQPFKDRVQAQIMGKNSTLESDIKDDENGVNTKGNKKFQEKAEEMNKFDNEHTGIGNNDQSIVQLGSHITMGTGKPAKKPNAFESIEGNKKKLDENKCDGSCIRKVGNKWRVVSGKTGKLWDAEYDSEEDAKAGLRGYFANENKIKIGDVFTEAKNNLKLKFMGLKENKVHFIDESSNKKYTLIKENFQKALNEGKMLKESGRTPQVQPVGYQLGSKFIDDWDDNHRTLVVSNLNNGFLSLTKEINGNVYDSLSTQEMNDWIQKGRYIPIQMENKTKRLNFKKDNFLCESHMFSLIPEDYKVHGHKFYMKDASENEYLIEWNDNLKQKAVIVEYTNKKKLNENMSRMKDLWNYKSSNSTRPLNEQERINEKQNLGNFLQKMKEFSKKDEQ